MTISIRRDDNSRRRLNALERQTNQLADLFVRKQDSEWQAPQQVRLCRTVSYASDDPTYPNELPGNTVRVVFIDGDFFPVPGNQLLVSDDRENSGEYSVVARTICGSLPPEGVILPAVYCPPMDADRGYWWLVFTGMKSIQFELDEALTTTDVTVEATVIREFGNGTLGGFSNVLVHNAVGGYDGLFSGPIGAVGFAHWLVGNEYIITQLEC